MTAVLGSTIESRLRADLERVPPLDIAAMAGAAAGLDRLTKPPGSLGRLEALVIQLAGITGRLDAAVDARAILVAAGDHGVTAQGVSAYPAEVTAQMVANFVAGGAAINVLSRAAGARVVVLDVGVARPIPEGTPDPVRGGRLVTARVRAGTADMTLEPAMTRNEALAAIDAGRRLVAEMRAEPAGLDLLGVGEMGIGNTTAASALSAVFTGAPVDAVTGPGTGIDETGRRRKVAVIEAALALHDPDPADPVGVLAAVGGLEIAALVGAIVEAAVARIPVVLDGFISTAAALVACALQPAVAARTIAAHRSTEPGHRLVLEHLGLSPVVDLDLRLGEASGAAVAIGIVAAAVAIRDGMATFDSAGVAGPA
ncbi:MAG: nicotinate-nucleotide--dimethylbenzimidazole phosphoribosyltransferase [Chloroflexota bacterium]